MPRLMLLFLAALLLATPFTARAQTTANATTFTYQGYLTDAEGAVTGTCAFQFTLYDAAASGSQIGGTQTLPDVPVTDGVFSVRLDFGAGAFEGSDRFLQIAVDCGSGLTVLAPRQPVTPAPYAQYALGAPWSGLTGIPAGFADGIDNDTTYSAGDGLALDATTFRVAGKGITTAMLADNAVDTLQLAPNAVTSAKIADGTIIGTDVAANTFWNSGGNSGTNPASHFLGTTDNTALHLRVNNANALRILPVAAGGTPNLLGGFSGNGFGPASGVIGATIPGGGQNAFPNLVTDNYGTVGGGRGNVAGDENITPTSAQNATVSGGLSNRARATDSTISGGSSNTTEGVGSSIGGGSSSTAEGDYATISGGFINLTGALYATVGGGTNNNAASSFSVISGGGDNAVNAGSGSIGGGRYNRVAAAFGTIGGGGAATSPNGNRVLDEYGTVGGGQNNQAGDGFGTTSDRAFATVGGGLSNTASGYGSVISGGFSNTASGEYSSITGGTDNSATGTRSIVSGGSNSASGPYSTVGGGQGNSVNGTHGTVGGGHNNTASGSYSAVPGGQSNTASGNYSLAAGRQASAIHPGAFVWADSQGVALTSPGANTFTARAAGGFWLGTDGTPDLPTDTFLNTSTGATLTTGGVWTNASDRALKAGFAPVDTQAVLAGVLALPITTWHYTAEGAQIRHLGPVAQDFYAAFGLGASDTGIGTVDADGVALAAIQGLNATLRAELATKDAQITALAARLDMLMLVGLGALAAVTALLTVGAGVLLARRPTNQSQGAA